MFRNFDTKGKNYFHPYNTRSRRCSSSSSTHPPPFQLKDTTNVPGSGNTVVKEEPTAGGPANVIPLTLYNAIQAALGAWKDWEAKRDEDSEENLKSKEHLVEAFTSYYKREKVLPATWTCEPATASTLVPSNKDNRPLGGIYLDPPEVYEDDLDSHSDSDDEDCGYGPMLHLIPGRPRIYLVPLEENETESWMQFKKLDESNCARLKVRPEITRALIPVDIRHPIVKLIGNFAVMGFNKSYEKYLDKDKCSQLRDSVVRKFAYYKLGLCEVGRYYLFCMLIEAVEEGIRGIYKAKVHCFKDNGVRTLFSFSYIDGTNAKKKKKNKGFKVLGAVELLQNNRGFSLFQDKKVYIHDSGVNMNTAMGPRPPWHSGLKPRMGSTSGYDYLNACKLKA